MKKFKLIILLCTAMIAMLFQNNAFGQLKEEKWYAEMEAKGKYGVDSVFCKKELAIFTELVKQQNLKDAYDSWTILFNNYPMCSQNIYSYGVNIVKYQMQQCKTNTAQQHWIDTLMLVYDRRIHFFGTKSNRYPEGYILGRKGVDMLKFRSELLEDCYNTLNKSIELQGEKSEAAVILCAMKATIDMENAHIISRDVVTNNYQKYIKLLNANKTEPSDKVAKAIEGVNDFYNLGYAASLSNNTASTNNTTSSSTSTSNNTSSNVTSNNNSQNASLLYQRYRKAAEQGNAEAQYRLGECYEYGYGVSIDYNKALIWYNKAIKLGNKNAENAYENCFIKGALDYIKTYQYNPNLEEGSDSYREFIEVCVVLKNKYKGNDTLNAQINNGIIEKIAEMKWYHKYLSTVMFYEGRPKRELSMMEKGVKMISGGRARAIGEVVMPTWTDQALVHQLIDQFDIYKVGLNFVNATTSGSVNDRDVLPFSSNLIDNMTYHSIDEYIYCFPESPYIDDVRKARAGYQFTVEEIERRRAEEYQRSETYAKNYVNKNVKAVIDDDVNTAVIFGSTINCSITIYGKCTYASKYGNDATYEIDVSSISITRKDGRTLDYSDYKCLYDRWNQKSVKLESRNRNFKGIWVQ
ncbi:MAG: tetratricopeptide repeat protein [Bacteroidales bacterium]|nr:tetratricopeptide repeat protein [Bacteroidales bacterium]